jgi:hypothetical protein
MLRKSFSIFFLFLKKSENLKIIIYFLLLRKVEQKLLSTFKKSRAKTTFYFSYEVFVKL